jgi:O-antigen ligase
MSPEKIIDRTIDTGLVFLIVFTPLAFGSVHVWAYTVMELTVFSLLIAWVLKIRLSPGFRIERGMVPLYVSLSLFLLVASFQLIPLSPGIIGLVSPKAYELYSAAIPGYESASGADYAMRSLSIYPYKTKISLVKIISYFGVFLLITHEIRQEKRIRTLIIALILVGSFEALYGLYGYFSKDPYIFGFRNMLGEDGATGTYVNRNHFSGYLGIVVFTGIGYFLSRVPIRGRECEGLKHRIIDYLNTARASKSGLLLVMIITMILGIFFSLSRMGIFAFACSFLFIASISALSKRLRLTNILFAILSLSLAAALWYGLGPLEERYYVSQKDFIGGRLPVWVATGRLIKDFPLVGTGLGTFEDAFGLYKPGDFPGALSRFEHAHNDYLEALSEVGVLGAAPALLGGFYFLIFLLRKWRRSRNALAKGVSLGGMGAMVYVCLHSITDFNMHIPANIMALIVVISLAYSALNMESGERK